MAELSLDEEETMLKRRRADAKRAAFEAQRNNRRQDGIGGVVTAGGGVGTADDEDCGGDADGLAAGWRERYYRNKLGIKLGTGSPGGGAAAAAASGGQGGGTVLGGGPRCLGTVCAEYVQGLRWVLEYYYQGCAAWGWCGPQP